MLVATAEGLFAVEDGVSERITDTPLVHLARDGDTLWALGADGSVLAGVAPNELEPRATVAGDEPTCLLPVPGGALIGTARAGVLRLRDDALERVGGFDDADGRDLWHTPWGGPPDTRSMAAAADGTVLVNVHVGGILRSEDGETFTPTIDIHTDIHQVLAHGEQVLAAGAFGLHVSTDGGRSWSEDTEGLPVTYLRAVAVAGDTVLVTAARGHTGGDAGVFRRTPDEGGFTRCDLPHPVSEHNIDTHRLAADGARAAFVTAEGAVYRSADAGATWEEAARGLPSPRALVI